MRFLGHFQVIMSPNFNIDFFEGDVAREQRYSIMTKLSGWDDASYTPIESQFPARFGSYMGTSVVNLQPNIREVRLEAIVQQDSHAGRQLALLGSHAAQRARSGVDAFQLRRSLRSDGRFVRREQIWASLVSLELTEIGDSYRVQLTFDCFDPRKETI